LAAQGLINLVTRLWLQKGHSTCGSLPKTSFSKSWLQA
jgi:hypothetical protein